MIQCSEVEIEVLADCIALHTAGHFDHSSKLWLRIVYVHSDGMRYANGIDPISI